MAGGSTLFLRPRSDGLLRDSLSWECLQDYMKQYGDVTSVWLPWKDGDRRYFGFVTFKDSNAAKQAVDASPHMIDAVEVLCDFKRNKQNSPAAHTLAAAPPPTAEKMDLLERFAIDEQLTWEAYLAPTTENWRGMGACPCRALALVAGADVWRPD